MKKFTTLALTLGLVSTILSGCGGTSTSSSTSSQTKETLIVGMECGYAPFNWSEVSSTSTNYPIANSAGSYADGYDVQIAIQIANALDRELVIQKVDWEGLIPAVQSGSIDIIIAGMSDTEDRRVNVDFTSAYYTSTHVLVVRKDSAFASATSIDDFAGATIVGQKGTLYDDLIDQMNGVIHAEPIEDVPTIIANVNAQVSDGTILELPVAKAVIATNPNLKYIEFSSGNGFDVLEEDKAVAIAIGKNRTDLLNSIDNVLAQISETERQSLMDGAIERQPQ